MTTARELTALTNLSTPPSTPRCTRKPFVPILAKKQRPPEDLEAARKEELSLICAAKLGDADATEKLLNLHRGILWHCIYKSGLVIKPEDKDDLFSLAVIALMEAIRDFDMSRGVMLASFLVWKCRGVLSKEAQRRARAARTCTLSDTQMDELLARDSDAVRRSDLPPAFYHLRPRLQQLLELRFGLHGKKEHTGGEIGRLWSISRSRINALLHEALGLLREQTEDAMA